MDYPEAVCGSIYKETGQDPFTYDESFNNEQILFGIVGFDSFGQGLMSILHIVTLESWVQIMYMFQDVYALPLAQIYFPTVLIIGYIFVTNLILAQIVDLLTRIYSSRDFEIFKKAEAKKINDQYSR